MLFLAIILLLALLAINLSNRSGIPSLLLFLVLGIICNLVGVEFENYLLSENISTMALVMIIFYGGFGTNWKMTRVVIKESIILSSLGVVLTALGIGGMIHFIFQVPLLESLLLGSVVSSTDFASVSNILSKKQLNLKYNTASILELESGSNDPMAYTLTMIFLMLLQGKSVFFPLLLLQQIIIGLVLGFLLGWIVNLMLQQLNLQKDGLATIFMFAMAVFTYALTVQLSGNGYLAVYILGMYVGNKVFVGKRDIIYFFDSLTELMQIALFFILGLLANPIAILRSLPISIVIMILLTFVVRPVILKMLLLPFNISFQQLVMLSWAGFRGAAAIAFAILVVNSPVSISIDIYHIVFSICLLSSLIQGFLMPQVAKITDMIDQQNRVLRNFNYYSAKSDMVFTQFLITYDSPLKDTLIRDINFDNNMLIVKIIRDEKVIIPRGDTYLKENDLIVLGGIEYFDPVGQDLIEFTVPVQHKWVGKSVQEMNLPVDQLLLAINRNDQFVMVNGQTMIEAEDRIIMLKVSKV